MKKKVLIFLLCFTLLGCNTKFNSDKRENNHQNGETDVTLISEEIIENLSTMNKIIVIDRNNIVKKTLIGSSEIEMVKKIISTAKEVTGLVTTEGNNWVFDMYDIDDKLIYRMYVWKSGHIGINNTKEYSILSFTEFNNLLNVIES